MKFMFEDRVELCKRENTFVRGGMWPSRWEKKVLRSNNMNSIFMWVIFHSTKNIDFDRIHGHMLVGHKKSYFILTMVFYFIAH